MGWREYAKQVQEARHVRHDRHKSPVSAPNVPNVTIVPEVLPLDPRSLRRCQAKLASLDPGTPLHGLPLDRWRQLLDDAEWLAKTFGTQAARDGWSAADLFGRWPSSDGWGGVADRLKSSRSLVMTADRAVWRMGGVTFSFNRGSYCLPLLWEG